MRWTAVCNGPFRSSFNAAFLLKALKILCTSAVEEDQPAPNDYVAIVSEARPRQEGVLRTEKHEGGRSIVKNHCGKYGAGHVVQLLGPRRSFAGGREQEGSNVRAGEAGSSGDEPTHKEGEIVTARNPMLWNKISDEDNQRIAEILTQKALVKKVIMLLLKPGFLPFGVTRL